MMVIGIIGHRKGVDDKSIVSTFSFADYPLIIASYSSIHQLSFSFYQPMPDRAADKHNAERIIPETKGRI